MNRIEYFKARLEATMSPADVIYKMRSDPEQICVVDVRNGPAALLVDRIPGALQVPQSENLGPLSKLPGDRTLVLYCWDTWCSWPLKLPCLCSNEATMSRNDMVESKLGRR